MGIALAVCFVDMKHSSFSCFSNKDNEVQCRKEEAAEIALLSLLVLSQIILSARDFALNDVKTG